MKIVILSAAVAAVVLAAGHQAEAGVKISVNLGGGYYCPPPVVVVAPAPCPPRVVYHRPVRYYYYHPAPVVVRPAPVVVYPDAYWHHRMVHRDEACGSVQMAYHYR
jgi:hypothetical protein